MNPFLAPPDLGMAKRFLQILAQKNEPIFAFQTFADRQIENGSLLSKIFCGTFEQYQHELTELHQKGAGVFVAINCTDGKGRKTENITSVRAIFVDLDGSPLEPILSAPLAPHLIIESSPKRYHAYWVVEEMPRENFSFMQKQFIELFQADPKVHDLPRVMRLPGFYHQKGSPFLTRIIQINEQRRDAIP